MRDRRRNVIVLAGIAAAIALAQQPTADLRILTHEASDAAPRRFQAAADLGLVAVSVLYTWTADSLPR